MSQGAYLLNAGTVPYGEAWDLQRSLAAAVSQRAIPDTIVLLEHPPVVTLGRRTDETELHLPDGAEVEIVETNRGGKSTDRSAPSCPRTATAQRGAYVAPRIRSDSWHH